MSGQSKQVVVSGAFDDIRSPDIRFLEEASKLGNLTVMLWTDDAVQATTGTSPRFSFAERFYFLKAVRYVSRVEPVNAEINPATLPACIGHAPEIWIDRECAQNSLRLGICQEFGLQYRVLSPRQLAGFPLATPIPHPGKRKKVVVTGCYDFFHSGHIRFFEEVSAYGDLYVIVGHDVNIRLLKGEGHPLLPAEERCYLAGSIRYVTQALISSGDGWLDAHPEIQLLKPDIYAVNEDGDKGGKREYCAQHGIQYLVLKRTPAPGLPARSSTDLRGF
jgi:cytidyltransferase-like protein